MPSFSDLPNCLISRKVDSFFYESTFLKIRHCGPVGGIITDMHFICRFIVRLCGRISPLLSRDISVLVRRYLCPGPKISPPVGFMPQLIPPTGIADIHIKNGSSHGCHLFLVVVVDERGGLSLLQSQFLLDVLGQGVLLYLPLSPQEFFTMKYSLPVWSLAMP